MKRPPLPREHLEQLVARHARMKAAGIDPSGNRDIDSTRMMHALGMKKRDLKEILEDYERHDWQGTIDAFDKPRER